MLFNSLINPLNSQQEALIEQLVQNDFDNINPNLYTGMAVPQIVEAMDEAYKRLAQLKSTPLGKALS